MTGPSTLRPDRAELLDLLAQVIPGQGEWRDQDYLWLTDHTNRLIELTDGYLEVLPVPTDYHQALLQFLYEVLREWTRKQGGTVRVAPLEDVGAAGQVSGA